jgi:hypothetical protein
MHGMRPAPRFRWHRTRGSGGSSGGGSSGGSGGGRMRAFRRRRKSLSWAWEGARNKDQSLSRATEGRREGHTPHAPHRPSSFLSCAQAAPLTRRGWGDLASSLPGTGGEGTARARRGGDLVRRVLRVAQHAHRVARMRGQQHLPPPRPAAGRSGGCGAGAAARANPIAISHRLPSAWRHRFRGGPVAAPQRDAACPISTG